MLFVNWCGAVFEKSRHKLFATDAHPKGGFLELIEPEQPYITEYRRSALSFWQRSSSESCDILIDKSCDCALSR